jgi:hypothetical protein
MFGIKTHGLPVYLPSFDKWSANYQHLSARKVAEAPSILIQLSARHE